MSRPLKVSTIVNRCFAIKVSGSQVLTPGAVLMTTGVCYVGLIKAPGLDFNEWLRIANVVTLNCPCI